ncbi:hypothetical protein BKA59DRAFT_453010 [Fusarium tricinctum]|uniref:DUF3669 domain-containing protein n=1 Tax=Fusarium tricinctum TaxID=61284 RepID=A0A8K0S515_9HYPO|nr:hypothetical protein BKA59DRAFT_453010 [Fusarium tricinctum]
MTSTNIPIPDLSTSYAIIGSSSRVDIGRTLSQSLYRCTHGNIKKHVGQNIQPPGYLEELASDERNVTFALNKGTVAMKLAKDFFSLELWYDYSMSKHICDAFILFNITGVNFPSFNSYTPRDDSKIWADIPHDYWFSTNAFLTDRIPPIPASLQISLRMAFSKSFNDVPVTNKLVTHDCLVHLYFGSLQGKTQRLGDGPLRNFELHLNHMIELNLDSPFYFVVVRDMATTLAALHWVAGTAANGVKFVLGGPRESQRCDATTAGCDQVFVWAYNFDEAGCIPLNETGVAMAVDAFMNNKPYYPRPFQQDLTAKYIWLVFKEAYLSVSRTIFVSCDPYWRQFPPLFIKGIEDRLKDRGLAV